MFITALVVVSAIIVAALLVSSYIIYRQEKKQGEQPVKWKQFIYAAIIGSVLMVSLCLVNLIPVWERRVLATLIVVGYLVYLFVEWGWKKIPAWVTWLKTRKWRIAIFSVLAIATLTVITSVTVFWIQSGDHDPPSLPTDVLADTDSVSATPEEENDTKAVADKATEKEGVTGQDLLLRHWNTLLLCLLIILVILGLIYRQREKVSISGTTRKYLFTALKIMGVVAGITAFHLFLYPLMQENLLQETDWWQEMVVAEGRAELVHIWTTVVVALLAILLSWKWIFGRSPLGWMPSLGGARRSLTVPYSLKKMLGILVGIALINTIIAVFLIFVMSAEELWWRIAVDPGYWFFWGGLALALYLLATAGPFSTGQRRLGNIIMILVILGSCVYVISLWGQSLEDRGQKAQATVEPQTQTGTVIWLENPYLYQSEYGNTQPGDRNNVRDVVNNKDRLELTFVRDDRRTDRWEWDKHSEIGFWENRAERRSGDLVIKYETVKSGGRIQFEGVWYGSRTGLPRPFKLILD